MKFRKYKPARAQALEAHHESDRKAFAKYVLEQDEDFPQRILFSRSQIMFNFQI